MSQGFSYSSINAFKFPFNIFVKGNKKLILAKNVYWTFRQLLLPSSAKIKMQMPYGVLIGICIHCVIKAKITPRRSVAIVSRVFLTFLKTLNVVVNVW